VSLRARLDAASRAWTRHQRHPDETLAAAMDRVPPDLAERVAAPPRKPESEAGSLARGMRWPHLSVYVDTLAAFVMVLPPVSADRNDPRRYVTPLPVPSAAAVVEARALVAEADDHGDYWDDLLAWWAHVALALVG
jgi:hypothetical protein